MLLEAYSLGCVADVLVIASFLSVPDPRERHPERKATAQTAHGRFADARSDFLGVVNLWRRFRSVAKDPGESMRRFCRRHSLSPARMRDWLDVHGQIRDICRELGIQPRGLGAPPRADSSGAAHGAASLRRRPHAGGAVLRSAGNHVPACLGLGPPSGRRAVDRRGRGGGDRACLRLRRRTDSCGVGREGRRRSRAPHLLRRPLGCPSRRTDGVRAGGAVRVDAHRPSSRAVRAGEPRGRARGFPAVRARGERIRLRSPLRRAQCAGAGPASQRGAQAAQPGRDGERRCSLCVLRHPGPFRRRGRTELRGVVLRTSRGRSAEARTAPRGHRSRDAPRWRGGVSRCAAGG